MRKIKYYRHHQIDQEKWDKTIDASYNGMVYAYTFFLNSMAGKRWDALILGDYEAVFPLVYGRKFGMRYLYQPFFCQQLGLFSKTRITQDQMEQFIKAIPRKFVYWDFHLNYENDFFNPLINFVNRTSFTIDLHQDYVSIYDKFNSDAKKNLAKSAIIGYNIVSQDPVNIAADCFFEAYGHWYPNVPSLKKKITQCAHTAIQLNKGFTRSIYGKDGQLWCSGFFFMAKNRIHYAMAAPTEEGKKYGATHILIDEVLKEFSNRLMVFDFEGSDLKSVAYFYAKFGSVKQHYLEIKRNRLPWWCQLIMSVRG